MAERLAWLPPAGRGMGDWYGTLQQVHWQCVECDHEAPQSPAVLEYQPEMDVSKEQMHKHSGWATLGWLVWWQCPRCEADVMTPVSAKQVAQWGRELGGWREA